MAEINLKVLFSQLRGGSKEAFTEIYDTMKQPVFTICWRIVQSKELAEDLTHDVFVKLYTSPPEPSVKNPRAWVFRMARNLAIDALRKKSHTDTEETLTAADNGYGDINLRLDIESAVSKLPRLEREILSLHLNADLSFKEIAHTVGLSVPAVYRKYRRTLNALRDELNGVTI